MIQRSLKMGTEKKKLKCWIKNGQWNSEARKSVSFKSAIKSVETELNDLKKANEKINDIEKENKNISEEN